MPLHWRNYLPFVITIVVVMGMFWIRDIDKRAFREQISDAIERIELTQERQCMDTQSTYDTLVALIGIPSRDPEQRRQLLAVLPPRPKCPAVPFTPTTTTIR